jgi:hypothetical protein
MCDRADREFASRGLEFKNLWGRPLHLIDCQNVFCEVDKYARVAHPEVRGAGGRTRIKRKYSLDPEPVSYGFPPKWSVSVPEAVRWNGVRPAAV